EADVLDLGNTAEVARHRARNLFEIIALYEIEMSKLYGLALVADEDLIARPHLSLVNAKRRQAADVRVHGDLEHMSREVRRLVAGVDRNGFVFLSTREKFGRIALERARHELSEDAQQLTQPCTRMRRDEANGYQMTAP